MVYEGVPPIAAPLSKSLVRKFKVERRKLAGQGEWHMLYFHSGGFVLRLCPLVPEGSYAQQDALADAAFTAPVETYPADKMILNGDSAGGHMALSLALRLAKAAKNTGSHVPGKLALFVP